MRQKRVVYSEAVGRRVCEAWAQGESLRQMSMQEGMPNQCTVRVWARERDDFRAMWEEARERRLELFERQPGLAKAAAGHLGSRRGYDEAVGARICARIASGESLRALAADRSLPSVHTIYNWLALNGDFRLAYQAACDARAEGLLEEAQEIADDDTRDLIEGPAGRLVGNPQAVQRARLMVEARRTRAAKTGLRRSYLDVAAAADTAQAGGGEDGKPKGWEDLLFASIEWEAGEADRARAADGAAWDGFAGREGEARPFAAEEAKD